MKSLNEDDYLVIDGGDTHFWAEIAVNMAAVEGKRLRGVLHPGPLSILGVGVPFSVAAKMDSPKSRVVLISGDGAFLAGGAKHRSGLRQRCANHGGRRQQPRFRLDQATADEAVQERPTVQDGF